MHHDNRPTHLDLFSGIGGFALAAEWAGFRTVAFVERNEDLHATLATEFPEASIYSDIRDAGLFITDNRPAAKVCLDVDSMRRHLVYDCSKGNALPAWIAHSQPSIRADEPPNLLLSHSR